MNYKKIFHIALLLISSPARAWEEICFEDKQEAVAAFVYPMIGLCALSVFIGSLWTMGWGEPQSFQYAMTRCAAVAVSLFGGYFLAVYLINAWGEHRLSWRGNRPLVQQFAGYALVVVFLLKILLGILPDFGVIAMLFQFYTLYVVWEGSARLAHIPEKERLSFTLLASAALLLCPWLIEWVFNELTVVLN